MYCITSTTFSSGIPKSIKVGPITYQIVMERKPVAAQEDGSVPVFGMVNFKEAKITLDEELHPAMQWQCLFHELMHIFFVTLGLEDPGEGQDDALAYMLMDFLIDNGFLVNGPLISKQFPALESYIKNYVDPD